MLAIKYQLWISNNAMYRRSAPSVDHPVKHATQILDALHLYLQITLVIRRCRCKNSCRIAKKTAIHTIRFVTTTCLLTAAYHWMSVALGKPTNQSSESCLATYRRKIVVPPKYTIKRGDVSNSFIEWTIVTEPFVTRQCPCDLVVDFWKSTRTTMRFQSALFEWRTRRCLKMFAGDPWGVPRFIAIVGCESIDAIFN